ncbi:hypothetical protein A0H81_06249 [Grifola frondosa]|uniref:BTB domain-containing protein n=1 Tax=Grifola frondosa TaxID=5627 RepID=A0A1C7MGE8_GRIFR|nr:hypothetical protein A0H81_06249 [Grifola frondosa]
MPSTPWKTDADADTARRRGCVETPWECEDTAVHEAAAKPLRFHLPSLKPPGVQQSRIHEEYFLIKVERYGSNITSSLAWNPETKEHPFTYSDADVTLVSSDGVEFRVHKIILTLASPFFRTIRCCGKECRAIPYPSTPLSNQRLGSDFAREFEDALAASLKYDIEKATDVLTSRLALLVKDAPLRVYAIACMLELEDVAKLAAKEVLQQKVYIVDSDFPELDKITAGAYHRLLEYCKKGGAVEGFSFVHSLKASSPCADNITPDGDTSQSVVPRNAPPPFDRSDADVILCSSDLVHFHVHSTVLRMISPFFQDELNKLTLEPSIHPRCGKPADCPDSTPLITLTEDSATISSLLSAYYDILLGDTLTNVRFIDTLDKSWTLFSAANKYGMQRTVKLLKTELRELVSKQPVHAYLLASRLDYQDIGIKAAQRSLREGLGTYLPEMEDISAKPYCQLWRYRRRCQGVGYVMDKKIDIIFDLWMEKQSKRSFDPPSSCHFYSWSDHVLPCWASPLIEHVRTSDIFTPLIGCPLELEVTQIDGDCPHCRGNRVNDIRRFAGYFDDLSEKMMTVVKLTD